MSRSLMLASVLLLGAATPAFAQAGPPSSPMEGQGGPGMMRGPGGPHGRMFASMSEAGRKTMMDALRAADPRTDHAATKDARDRVLDLLDDDKLNVPALKRAMDEEREAANASRIRHQAAMLAGFQQLSAADRKAFTLEARAMRARMEAGMKNWAGKRGDRGMNGMPPPPPPM